MEWHLSDGTVVRLGGHVDGDSSAAHALRDDVELLRAGRPIEVQVDLPPGGGRALELDDAGLVAFWVHQTCVRFGIDLVSGPEPQFPDPPIVDDDAPDLIF